MWIRIRLYTLMWIRIRLYTLMRIWTLFLVKVMQITGLYTSTSQF